MHFCSSALAVALLSAAAYAPSVFAHPEPTIAARLAIRQESSMPTPSTSSPSADETALESSSSSDSGAAATTLVGRFTAGANGVYSITSVSNYIEVAGRTLSAGGPDALVGGVRVTVGSDGVIANGNSVALAEETSTTSQLVLTSQEPSTVSSVPGQAQTADANTETEAGSAAMATARVGAAVVGGLLGVLAL